MALNRLIARKGRASITNSDNAKSFVEASKWISKINKDEKMQEYLIKQQIKWKFGLRRAPWWGGQLKKKGRINEVISIKSNRKDKFYQASAIKNFTGHINVLNNRLLIYIEDDITGFNIKYFVLQATYNDSRRLAR